MKLYKIGDQYHLASPSGRYTPLQARKPCIIVIERDPLAAGLDGQCRKPCIRHKVAARVRFGEKAFKNPPVSFTRFYGDAVGLSEKDVDIGKDPGAFMTSSSSPERLRSIPGRMPSVAFDTGNSTRFRRLVFGFDRISANPSSTSDVRVRPSSAACILARFKRSSFILIVVLIHQC